MYGTPVQYVWKPQNSMYGNPSTSSNPSTVCMETPVQQVWKPRHSMCGNPSAVCMETPAQYVWKSQHSMHGNPGTVCMETPAQYDNLTESKFLYTQTIKLYCIVLKSQHSMHWNPTQYVWKPQYSMYGNPSTVCMETLGIMILYSETTFSKMLVNEARQWSIANEVTLCSSTAWWSSCLQ